MFIKVGLRASVLVADECWSRYRQHPSSSWIVAQKTGQHDYARVIFFNWLAEYLLRQKVRSKEIWKLLKEEQRTLQLSGYVQKREWNRAIGSLLVLIRYHPRASFTRAWQALRLPARLRRLLRILYRGNSNGVGR